MTMATGYPISLEKKCRRVYSASELEIEPHSKKPKLFLGNLKPETSPKS